jgi:hypothetical protein
VIYIDPPYNTGARDWKYNNDYVDLNDPWRHSDLTMLEEAAVRWKHFANLWEDYCQKENEESTVRPILVVQVEDGNNQVLTRTPLGDVARAIERHSGPLALNEIVHCFQDQTEIEVHGHIVRKMEASLIQDSPDVRVVLFKTALSTGWDCPRAEIIMSFRRAQDSTSIAQLVGRMVRTPLARRVGIDEILDTVELFLPHYNKEAQILTERWRVEYNTERPHSALGYRPPAPRAIIPTPGHGDVENKPRFPHLHTPGGDYGQRSKEALH